MSLSARPSFPQLEALISFLEENPGIAKGHLRSAQGKWETKRKWEEISETLNSMGTTQKDAKGWSKFWTDKKYYLKKIVGQQNADANRTGGGGPANLPSLTNIEERMVALLGGRGFAVGDSHFSVPLLQEPTTSTAPAQSQTSSTAPTSTQPQSDDSIILPLPESPDPNITLAATQSTPRRSPRIRARSSRQPTRPTVDRGRRSQIQTERDRLIYIEERRVEAELIQARALQENLAGLTAAGNNIAEAINALSTRIVDAIQMFAQIR